MFLIEVREPTGIVRYVGRPDVTLVPYGGTAARVDLWLQWVEDTAQAWLLPTRDSAERLIGELRRRDLRSGRAYEGRELPPDANAEPAT